MLTSVEPIDPTCALMRAMRAIVLALVLLVAPAAAAADTADSEITIDLDAVSVAVTYARRAGPRMLWGGGVGFGPSPLLGTIRATNSHYDPAPNITFLELAQVQGFARFEAASWLHLDTGLRAGWFIHGSENFTGGPFLMAYIAPWVGWRWFWIGPRVSAGVLREKGGENGSRVLVVDYVAARIKIDW
jgi:hypothetical protein